MVDFILLKKSLKKNLIQLLNVIPQIFLIISTTSLFIVLFDKTSFLSYLTNNNFLNAIIMDVFGSVMMGNPVTAFILGKSFLDLGLNYFLITVFILAWTTVGVVQFPLESKTFGFKFALIRNLLSFVFAIIIAYLAVILYNLI